MREGFHEADDEHVVSAYPWHVATTPRGPERAADLPAAPVAPAAAARAAVADDAAAGGARDGAAHDGDHAAQQLGDELGAPARGSVRLEAIHLADHGNETSLEVDQDYAQARDHGVEQGYHLFTDSQVPEAPATPRSEWKVDVANLASTNDNTDLLKDGQLSKRASSTSGDAAPRARPRAAHARRRAAGDGRRAQRGRPQAG